MEVLIMPVKPLKIEISLNQDGEIRDYIKQLVEERVKSLGRSDIDKLIQDTFIKKIASSISEEDLKRYIKQRVSDTFVSGGINDRITLKDTVIQEVRNIVGIIVRDLDLEKIVKDTVVKIVTGLVEFNSTDK